MNRIAHTLNLYNWPTWLTIAVVVIIALIIPFLLTLGVSVRLSDEANRIAVNSYLSDIVEETTSHIEDELLKAGETLEGIAINRLYRTQLLSLLGGEGTNLLRPAITNLLGNRLIESGQFLWASLLSPTGRIVADTRAGRVGSDDAESPAYQAGVNAQLLGESQRLVIYQDGAQNRTEFFQSVESGERVRIDVVQAVTRVDGTLAGYLVGSINLNDSILDELADHDDFIPVVSYLISRDGLIISESGEFERALASSAVAPITQATGGQSGVTSYFIDGQRISGAYGPMYNNRFGVIVETTEDVNLIPSLVDVLSGNLLLFAGAVLLVILLSLLVSRVVQLPISRVRDAMAGLMENNNDIEIPSLKRGDEIGGLSRDFVQLRERLAQFISDQDARVGLLVRDIRATQEVARYTASQRNIQELMDDVVNLIVRQFPNIYHAQIFLLDSEGRWAVLRASTGKAGRQLLARGHRLQVGSVSVIGQVTRERRTIVARDTASSDVHKRNEFLPDTRSELAIPLTIGNRIIGALDVQSKESDAFAEDQVNILSTMADQIAISLDNARLYQESLERLAEVTDNNRQKTQFDWEDFLSDQRTLEIREKVGYETIDFGDLRERAIAAQQTVIGEKTERNTLPIAVPIKLRGHTIGAVVWELPAMEISSDKIALAEQLVNRLAVTLDNARLFQSSQRATERERIVNEIASKITGKTDINEILETAVREVGQALRAPEVNIRLNVGQQAPGKNGNHG